MPAPRPDYFRMRASLWLNSARVLRMTLEERGAFITLLCFAWVDADCGIPDDPRIIARMLGISVRRWNTISTAVLAEFSKLEVENPEVEVGFGKLANETLLLEHQDVTRKMRENSEQRTLAAESRWGKSRKTHDSDMRAASSPHMQNGCEPDATSTRHARAVRGRVEESREEKKRESVARAPARGDATPAPSPSVVEVFPPGVSRLAAVIESKMPKGKPGRGSTRRLAGVAYVVKQLGEERVAAALEALPSLADRCPDAGMVLGRLIDFEDSLDGPKGIGRIEWIERLLRENPPPESESSDDEYVLR